MSARSKLGRILEDIGTLEVNTVLCDGMTGEQMTDPRHALFDLGDEYLGAVARLVPGFQPPPESQGKDPIRGARGVFELLHRAARDALRGDAAAALAPSDRALLTRVKVKSGQLVALFDRLRAAAPAADSSAAVDNALSRADINGSGARPRPPPLPLSRDDHILLRKIWELSTDTIALQTVITLDGDVVSRVQRDYAGAAHADLHRLHGDGIAIAIRSWGAMIKAAADLLASLVR